MFIVYQTRYTLGLKTKNTRGPDRLGGVEAHVKPNHLADHHALCGGEGGSESLGESLGVQVGCEWLLFNTC